ncbi:MAG TPA: branched-chain amino acid ABC transporter ATP-binding protein/permease [Actinomycetota bacterium]|nr:branched-chain amino acid ABC transporter ATP-binding protein/permease [Actinomycetota bacterium]
MRRRIRAALIGWAMLAAVLAVAAALVAAWGTAPLRRTATDLFLVATLVVGLQVFVGNSGIVSFGHLAFVGVGAYAAALVTIPEPLKAQALPDLPGPLRGLELGLVPSVAVGAALAAALAAAVGGAVARMRELAMAMATLALLVLVHAVLANWDSVTRGGYGIYGVPGRTTLWVALAGLLLATLVARLYRASRAGLRLQAAREDPLPARAVGVNVAATRFGGWVASAAMMGGGGALLAQHLLAFDPDQFFFALTFTTLAMLVIGGRASVTGAVAGAALVTVAQEALRQVERGGVVAGFRVPELPGLVQLAVAVLIILVLVFRPAGLLGRAEIEELLPSGPRRRSRGRAAGGPSSAAAVPADARPVLRAEGVVMDFAGLRALAGVSLELRGGEILGLIGPNGSGKTTLLNVVSGVYRPTAGRVLLEGRDITGWPAHRIARLGLARTFQNIRLFGGLTVRENVEVAAPAGASDADVDRVLEELDLEPHAGTVAAALPYGVQRRVEIARAVIRRPAVLLLDEPAAGMNEAESERLLATIAGVQAALGCSVLVIDHDLRLILRLCDRVQVLNEGAVIAEGPPREVARDPAVIEAYLGTAR